LKYLKLLGAIAILLIATYFLEEHQLESENKLSSTDRVSSGQAIEDYKQARQILWQSLYPNKGITLYCEQSFVTSNKQGINIEHVFPMSWVTSSLDCGTRNQCRENSNKFNQIEADLHNLYPSRSDVNQERSSFAFAEIAGEKREFGRDCNFEVDRSRRLVEPAPHVRGEVARSMFYMAYQYRDDGLKLFDRQIRLLQEWHNSDLPSDHERARNNKIEQLQGNRNIFIDAPEKLDKLIAEGYFS